MAEAQADNAFQILIATLLVRAVSRPLDSLMQAAGQIADLGGGALMAAFGILAALRERDRSGEGQVVDVSMADGALSWLAMVAARFGVAFRDTMVTKIEARGSGFRLHHRGGQAARDQDAQHAHLHRTEAAAAGSRTSSRLRLGR